MAAKPSPKPKYFATPAQWRAWLEKHHAGKDELLVGFWKRETGKPSITWPESVDQALCFGWIDGVRRSLGPESYTIRFTRRRPGSTWSAINIRKVAELEKAGQMAAAGRAAFKGRTQSKSAIYAYEQDRKNAKLPPEAIQRFKADPRAWACFSGLPDWYLRNLAWWFLSAKKPETREKRLAQKVKDAASGKLIADMNKYKKS